MVCKKDRWEKRKDINLDVLTGVISFEVQRKQQHKGSSYYVWILQNHAKMFEIFPPGFWCWAFFGQSFPINRSWVALKGNIEWVFVLVSVLLMWPKYMVKMNIQRSGRIGGGIWIFVCLFLTAWEAATIDATRGNKFTFGVRATIVSQVECVPKYIVIQTKLAFLFFLISLLGYLYDPWKIWDWDAIMV